MHLKLIISIILATSALASLHAQTLKFADPVKLGAAVNTEAEEVSPLLTHDGQSLYFVRALYSENIGGKYAGMDIWMSQRQSDGTWSKASNNIGMLNNKDNNAVLGIKSDDQVLYLLNTYNNQRGIAFTKKHNAKWTSPEVIEVPGISREDFVGFYMSPDYDVLLISMRRGGNDNEDLFVSEKNNKGDWSAPVNLGTTINTEGFEISPFLSDDKKRLYFASNGHGGLGDADIYVSERLYESWTVWSKPKNLGPTINSSAFDAYFSISDDSTVMFSSNRDGKMSDIYESKILGEIKNSQLALKESLIEEARNILADLRNEGSQREHFIEFDGDATQIPDRQKNKLTAVIKDLNYQRYSRINLLSFANTNLSEQVHRQRLDKIVNYLKLSGINEDKINVTSSGKMSVNESGELEGGKQGVLIIISNPPK